ncbi:MAG: flavodoxin family protein [Bacteroidales bacterium]|jgi:multimeric flavodoxin WrbA|nr:flavodoxin family protein [Bacteroidales bacterium]
MDRREFLKIAGTAVATLAVREGVGALVTEGMKKGKKVVAINGSPNLEGNTHYALSLMGDEFAKENVDFSILSIGREKIKGCIACMTCKETGECPFATDRELEIIEQMKNADAIVLASPVYYGGIAGTMKQFLDKAFYSAGDSFAHKLGASVVTENHSGGSVTTESLNQYLLIRQINVVASSYWNVIKGHGKEAIRADEEGERTIRTLAINIANALKNQ